MAGGAKEGDAARPLFVYEAVRLFIIWCEQEWGIPRTFPADLISDKAGTPGGSECYGCNGSREHALEHQHLARHVARPDG
jgi:hypothetical protein